MDAQRRPFQQISTRRSFEEALAQLVEQITTGELPVGQRMPSEREIAAEMGISRPTLREALKLLVKAGVIEVQSRTGGMIVRTAAIPVDLRAEQYALLEGVGHVLETRRIIETQVAQLAGQTATDEDFAALQATIDLQSEHFGEHAWMLQLDERFHFTLARSTRNPMLQEFVRLIFRRLAIARDMTPRGPKDPQLEVDIHVRTLAALCSRDPLRIDEAMDEHMSYLEDVWEQETGLTLVRLRPATVVDDPTG